MKMTWFQKILVCIALFIAMYVMIQIYSMRSRRYHLYQKEGFGNIGIVNNQIGDKDISACLIKASANSCYDANGFIEIGDELNNKGLYHVLQKGCRFLDFEVYNIDGAAGIGYSGSSDFSSLETNTVPTLEVLNKIMDCAFTSPCPNPMDPLFLQFRMKTVKASVFEELANDINTVCGHKLITEDISGGTTISTLKSKIAIIVYSMPPITNLQGEDDVDRTMLIEKITSKIPQSITVIGSGESNTDFNTYYEAGPLKIKMPLIDDMIDENSNLLYSIEQTDNKRVEQSFQNLTLSTGSQKINVVPYKYYIKDEHLEKYEQQFKTSAFINRYGQQ